MNARGERERAVIDWPALRQRLEAAQARLERGHRPEPSEQQRILRERARTLARQPMRHEEQGETLQVLEFLLASETYGLELPSIEEVHPLRDVTPLPGSPPFLVGIMNLRGRILSVIDIRRFFDLPAKGITDLNKVIVLKDERLEVGILADVLLGIRAVPVADLQPSLPTLTGIRADYLRGVTAQRLVVLEPARLLADEKLNMRS